MAKRIFIFLSISMVSIFLFQTLLFLGKTPSSDEGFKIVEIERGATFLQVTNRLDQEGLITDPVSFLLLGKITQNESKIKPGEYRLNQAIRPLHLLNTLVEGNVLAYKVVIPEGTSSKEIGMLLENAGLVGADVFYQVAHNKEIVRKLGFSGESLEGFLFPDTYHFTKQDSAEAIVSYMVAQFRAVFDESFEKQAKKLGMMREEVMTLASIIEKETGNPSERSTISGVFHNRLKQKMRLQSDPTVIFSLTNFDGNIRKKDLFNDSPYNTYRVAGLPPGPISNPGREAIYAALFPEDVDYIFFVSKNNGSHYFSKTLQEHNKAVRKYQLKQNDEVMCRNCTN